MGKPKIKKTIDTTLADHDGKFTDLGMEFVKEFRAVNKEWLKKLIKVGSAAEISYMIDTLKYDALFERLLMRTK